MDIYEYERYIVCYVIERCTMAQLFDLFVDCDALCYVYQYMTRGNYTIRHVLHISSSLKKCIYYMILHENHVFFYVFQ